MADTLEKTLIDILRDLGDLKKEVAELKGGCAARHRRNLTQDCSELFKDAERFHHDLAENDKKTNEAYNGVHDLQLSVQEISGQVNQIKIALNDHLIEIKDSQKQNKSNWFQILLVILTALITAACTWAVDNIIDSKSTPQYEHSTTNYHQFDGQKK